MLRKHKLKITVSVLAIVFVFVMYLVMMGVQTASASDIPTLFVNDMVFHAHARLPLREIDGVFYIPLDIFRSMPIIRMESGDNFTAFFILVNNRNRNMALSFNVNGGSVWNRDSEPVPGAAAVVIDRHVYLPAIAVANALGLTIETAEPVNGHHVLRIRDGTSRQSFDDILLRFTIQIPEAPPETEPIVRPPPPTRPPPPPPPTRSPYQSPQTTVPTTTVIPETTTNPQNTRNINNYIMFHNFHDINTSDNYERNENELTETAVVDKLGYILDFLSENEIRALFFISGEEILANPANLRRIFAFGHDIGINIDREYVYVDELVSGVESVNALIYTLIKQKTRLYTVTANFDDEFMYKAVTALYDAGYFLCRSNVEGIPHSFEDIYEAVGFLRQQQENIWMFDLSILRSSHIEIIANAANERFYINFSHINNANVSELVHRENVEGFE